MASVAGSDRCTVDRYQVRCTTCAWLTLQPTLQHEAAKLIRTTKKKGNENENENEREEKNK